MFVSTLIFPFKKAILIVKDRLLEIYHCPTRLNKEQKRKRWWPIQGASHPRISNSQLVYVQFKKQPASGSLQE